MQSIVCAAAALHENAQILLFMCLGELWEFEEEHFDSVDQFIDQFQITWAISDTRSYLRKSTFDFALPFASNEDHTAAAALRILVREFGIELGKSNIPNVSIGRVLCTSRWLGVCQHGCVRFLLLLSALLVLAVILRDCQVRSYSSFQNVHTLAETFSVIGTVPDLKNGGIA